MPHVEIFKTDCKFKRIRGLKCKIANTPKIRGGKLQIGPHHCDQWEKLPQIHILDYMFEAEGIQSSNSDLNLNLNEIWKEKQKEKKKRQQPHGLVSGIRPI